MPSTTLVPVSPAIPVLPSSLLPAAEMRCVGEVDPDGWIRWYDTYTVVDVSAEPPQTKKRRRRKAVAS